MRPTATELAEWYAFEYHARRRLPRLSRRCYNTDGTPKRRYLTRRAANRVALKYQESYWCEVHGCYHVGGKRRKEADTISRA